MRIVNRDDFIKYLQKMKSWGTKYDYTRGVLTYVDNKGAVLATGRYSNSGQDPEYIIMDVVEQKREVTPVKAAPTTKKGKK